MIEFEPRQLLRISAFGGFQAHTGNLAETISTTWCATETAKRMKMKLIKPFQLLTSRADFHATVVNPAH